MEQGELKDLSVHTMHISPTGKMVKCGLLVKFVTFDLTQFFYYQIRLKHLNLLSLCLKILAKYFEEHFKKRLSVLKD